MPLKFVTIRFPPGPIRTTWRRRPTARSGWTSNAIMRFDPDTAKFESFPSNKSGATVRQMLGRAGEAWGGESGNDRLVVVIDR